MSRHLSRVDIETICSHIASFRGKLTWEALETSLQEAGYTHTRWAIRQHDLIKAAYDAKKKAERTVKDAKKSAPKAVSKPSEESVAALKARIHALEGQMAVVLDNAAELGIPLERMQRAPHPVAYNPTPQRR
jgi:phage tail tape-measure protein